MTFTKNTPRSFNRAMGLKITRFWTGRKERAHVSSDTSLVNNPIMVLDNDTAVTNADQSVTNSAPQVESPVADNDDVWRRRFSKHGVKRIVRYYRMAVSAVKTFLAFVALFGGKKLSRSEKLIMAFRLRRWDEVELDEHRVKQEAMRLYQFHRLQAKLLKPRIIEVLTQLKFCEYRSKNDRVYVRKRMRISIMEVSAYSYVFHFQLPAPFGVNVQDIATEVVTNIMAASIGKKINIILDQDGLRLIIEVGSTLSIPNFVTYQEMIESMKKNLPLLSYPVGRSVNGSLAYRNIDAAPHVIIAGSSGAGKSNGQNVIICTLISRNNPLQLRCIFIDLKGGLEFSFYEGLPHLQPMVMKDWTNSGIVERSADVPNAMRWIMDECERRQRIIKAAGAKDLNEFNRRKHLQNRLPKLLVFFDEFAIVKKSKFGNEAENILSEIGNVGRSSGIHVILSTQYPGADILSPFIAVNFMQRIAFNMSSGGSQSVVGNWDAHNLSPVGRAILHTSQGNMQVQFPRITNSTIKTIVGGAIAGNVDIAGMMSVDADEVLNWALTNQGGKLDITTLENQYKGKISQSSLRDLIRSMDNQVFEVQGTFYRIIPPAGTRSRYMELDDADSDGRSDADATSNEQRTSEVTEIEVLENAS